MEYNFNDVEKLALKKRLKQYCVEIIKTRIEGNEASILNAQINANSEEKSSAGDKYETSRAMSHIEKDMLSRQLVANQNELIMLLNIDVNHINASAVAGSFIVCGAFSFFIAVGLGKVNFETKYVYLLSPHAPVAKMLMDKKKGDGIVLNKINEKIVDIF